MALMTLNFSSIDDALALPDIVRRAVGEAALEDSIQRLGVVSDIRDGVLYLQYYNRAGASYLHTIQMPAAADAHEYVSELCSPKFVQRLHRADRAAEVALGVKQRFTGA